jgi:hypothetical protein
MLTDDQLAPFWAQVREASRLRAAYTADRENEEAFAAMVRGLLACHSAACVLLTAEERQDPAPPTHTAPQVVEAAPATAPGRDDGPPTILAFQRALTRLWADAAAALAGDEP